MIRFKGIMNRVAPVLVIWAIALPQVFRARHELAGILRDTAPVFVPMLGIILCGMLFALIAAGLGAMRDA
ncbi:hypothetical protein Q5H91_02615 [Sphingomonas sp. KR1UV-12]|uniref:Uncharacterized protein n=1 Tax=Sphingomonas aurea TaxID=3063994 RepID=A0ABT9EGJ4_9SPHN|nr:hypothetical protein [Sphingomonas sp. KR1UV-12]MDP1026091.1 hypothetical protein [Sphingomonas sp. KR1UV-12]